MIVKAGLGQRFFGFVCFGLFMYLFCHLLSCNFSVIQIFQLLHSYGNLIAFVIRIIHVLIFLPQIIP